MGISSAMSRVLAIPELVDHIISLLHSDIPTLKACSLVSAAWEASASPHIFATIALRTAVWTIRTSADEDMFENTYLRMRHSPRVRAHARDLRIVYTGSTFVYLYAELRLDQLASALAYFPLLRTVRIDTQCAFTSRDSTHPLPSALDLDTFALDIYSHTFRAVSPTALYGLFASIDTLQLTFHGYFSPNTFLFTDSASLSHAVRRTRALTIHGFQDTHSIPASQIVAASLDHTTLRCLTLDDYSLMTDVAPVNLFLRQHFNHMSTFRLVIRRHSDITMDASAVYPPQNARLDFDLSACADLRTVQITFWFNPISSLVIQQRRQALWSLSVSALSRVPAGVLADVCFELRLLPGQSLHGIEPHTASQSISALRDLQWDLLEAVLDRQPCLSIEVRLVYDGPRLTASQMALILAQQSPRLTGAVRFSSMYDEFKFPGV